jgi:PAS domain S-box-containing protein
MSDGLGSSPEHLLASTLRSLAEGVVAADFVGRVTYLNPMAERLTGWKAGEAIGRSLTDVFRISHPSGETAEFIRLGGSRGGRAILLTNRSGQLVPIVDNTAPIRDSEGSLVGLVILFRPRDEGGGPVAEQAPVGLRDQILEGIGDPLFCLDAQWRFTYVNAPAAAAFMAERQSLIGRALWNKFPPSVHRRHYQDFCAALLKRERRSFDLHDEGAGRWWEASIYPFHEGLLVLLRDVTQKKEAEEHAARMDRLESLGLLARGFAHDFNNLLTVILGNVSLARMRTTSGNDPVGRELEAAYQATQQAQGLVQNLLTFARGGAPVRRRLKIQPLIEDIVNQQPVAEGSTLRLALGPSLGEAEWDAGQIRRLISNLVRNSFQAIPRGRRGDVFVRAFTRRREDEASAVIEVIDNGRGIAPENLPSLFEPYFTTRAEENASGLGLTVCESIVRAHGGQIEVRSYPGQTVFTVTLPVLAGLPSVLTAAAPASPRPPRPMRVLVLEDEPLIRQLITTNLAARGFNVETTTDGTATVQRYREEFERGRPFDLVVLDLSIPSGQGGRETMDQLRALHPGVRAIVSSGYSDDAVMSRYMDYGFRAVLPKPYDPGELVALVTEVLEE